MSWLLSEGICDATIAYITAAQTAKFTDVAARFTALPMDMPDFHAIRLSLPNRERESDFPVLYLIPDQSVVGRAKGGTATAAKHRIEFAILAYHAGADDTTPTESVERLAMRYGMAVLEMLYDMHDHSVSTYHVGGNPIHWGAGTIYYRSTYTSASGEYLGDARVVIECEHREVR